MKFLKFGAVFLLGLFLVVLVAYQLAYLGRLYPGVAVAGVNLGNKTKQEAKMILGKKIETDSPQKLVLVRPRQIWEEELKNFEFSYKIEEALENAYQIGRKKNPWLAWQERKTAWSQGINLPFAFQINETLLEEKLKEVAQPLFIPAIEPQVKISEKKVVTEPGKNGQEVDLQALKKEISASLEFLKNEPISLPLVTTNPKLNQTELEQLKTRAEKFLNKKLKLVLEDQTFILAEKELIDFLSPTGFNQEKINQYMQNLASSLNRPPQNAAFRFEGGRVTVFRPAKEGIKLREKETSEQMLASLQGLEEGGEKEITLSLEVEKTSPQIKTEEVNNLGIRQLLGKGVSYFRGSIASRIHNITLASSRLNGTLVAPQEIFSFNQALGEVSQTTGYKEAYIIKEGRTILGDGGGVCQVSTTLFRAALNAGLAIEERHPHAYRVSYYEQGFPPGLDATVWEPTADLKLKNDTSAYILIQSSVNPQAKTLIFELYGTSDGRVATIGQSRIWDQVPPPPDLYQDDPTLPTGTVKQIDWQAWGAKVAFGWKVTKGNEVLQERTFYSAYRPWQAVYLRGTGGTQ